MGDCSRSLGGVKVLSIHRGERLRSKDMAGSAEGKACEEDEERKMEGIRTAAREGARQRVMMADSLSRRSSGAL